MKTAEFSAHPLFEKLKQFEERLNSEEVLRLVDSENLNFYRTACGFVRSQLDKAFTVLINPNELNEVTILLINSLEQLSAYLNNNNLTHLNNIEINLYPLLKLARNFPTPGIDDHFSYSALINDLKTLSDNKIRGVSDSINTAFTEVKRLEDELAKRETEVQNVGKTISEKQNQIEVLNQNFQTNFDLIKSTETKKFEELRDRLKAAIDQQAETIDNNTKSLVDRLNRKEVEAKKLVNVIGNIGATGNYQLVAEAHRKSADNWRQIAILFMIGLSIIIIATLAEVGSKDYDWKMALIRILSALVLTYPATYAARESAKHRKLENLNRKAELELASINPFIEILSEEKKQQIKEKLVEKYFGNNDGYIENDASEDTHSVPFKVLDKVVDIFKEVKKS